MRDNTNSSTAPDGEFEKVLAGILQDEKAGKPVDLSRVVRLHPRLEAPLREFFRNRAEFQRLASGLTPTASHPAAPSGPDLTPGSQFAGYEILKELGRGGMGVVYLARQRSANRLVALKVLRMDRLAHLGPWQRQEWLMRFRTEGQAAARIDDERVVAVYEVGAQDDCPFYSMRYVEGRSLAETVNAGPLPNRPAASLMEQVARAVQAIHDQGVLHRDLKPHNILVDARGRPHVTDFGLAKWLDAADSLTHTGDLLGSPHYMSPEQAQDSAKVSKATDVYGLGATLYALLTGRPPFQGTTVAETLHQVRCREPVPPRRVNPAVDRDLNTITLKYLEKEPERRFGSASELADELKRYLEGRPIRTRPLSLAGRIWRWCRRNPVLASLSAAAVVLITLAGSLFLAYSAASRSADRAGQALDEQQVKLDEQQVKIDQVQEESKQEKDWANRKEYEAQMHLVQREHEANNLAQVRELLEAQVPRRPGATDYRGSSGTTGTA
jgi:serine/threonine protein kinase